MKNITILFVLTAIVLAGCGVSLTTGDVKIKLGNNGEVFSITKNGVGFTTGGATYAAKLTYGSEPYRLDKSTITGKSAIPDGYMFTYQVATNPALTVDMVYILKEINGAMVFSRKVNIQKPSLSIHQDLRVDVPVLPATLTDDTWLPLRNGTAGKVGNNAEWTGVYNCTTNNAGTSDLAVPLVSFPNSALNGKRCTVMTDPYFSSVFTRNSIYWTYPSEVGLTDDVETREIYLSFHDGNHNDAFRTFYDNPLADVPTGQEWLKEIAMVNYDYLSNGKTGIRGAGWYENIEALSKDIPDINDRAKIALTIHGWYDRVGKYAYNPVLKTLNREPWPHYINGISSALQPYLWDGFEMSVKEIHNRIQYARDRGYKVVLYFADGLSGCPLNGSDFYDPSHPERLFPPPEGYIWTHADTYWQPPFRYNPADPWVQDFFIGYTEALMHEFGNEINALVWDETLYMNVGILGIPEYPAYTNREFMRLIKKMTAVVHDINPDVAFLTSDDSGLWYVPPYALVADGTYQDAHGDPQWWPYGYFPNYRNQLWGCNWYALNTEQWIKESVENSQAPVVWTDGWGTCGGWAKLSRKQKNFLLDLFEARKQYPTDYSKLIK